MSPIASQTYSVNAILGVRVPLLALSANDDPRLDRDVLA